MSASQRQNSPTGKPHIVKLYNKEISVTVEYSSPPKNNSREIDGNQSRLRQHKNSTKIIKNAQKNIIYPFDKKYISKYFYRDTLNPNNNLVWQFQNFHQDLLYSNDRSQRKIKVYSKEKRNAQNIIPHKFSAIPIKTITIQKKQKQDKQSRRITAKIKLYSPSSKKKQPLRNSNIINIKLYSKNKQQHKTNLETPSRKRNYKLQVTSSKSRGKNSSLLTYKEQASSEVVQYDHRSRDSPAIDPLRSFNAAEASYEGLFY